MRKYTEQELEQIREEYMDKAAFIAPEEVKKILNELHEAFNMYLDACSAFEFNNGFLYAQMLMESNGNKSVTERRITEQEQRRESIMQAIEKIEDKERLELIERFAKKLVDREVA